MKEKKKQDCEVSYKNVCPISQKESEIKGFVNSAKCAIRCQIKLTIDEYIGYQTKNEKNCSIVYPKDCQITEKQLLDPKGLNNENPANCEVLYQPYYDKPH